MFDTPINHFKSVFAHKFFVQPADQNYLLARFCRIQGMHEEFYWQSLQALEKYLKAGLILNDHSVKKYGHDIEKLWESHKNTFGETAIKDLSKPDLLQSELWQNRPIEHFISKINKMGHSDGRYGLISYSASSDDIFKLDQIVFELRRRTIGLKWIVGDDWEVEQEIEKFKGLPFRKVIEDFPTYQIRLVKIPQYSVTTAGTEMSDILHAWNFSFLRENTDYEKPAPASVSSAIGAVSNSYLFLLFEALEQTATTPEAIDRVAWLIDSIKFGRDIENAFRQILARTEKHKS